MQTLCDATPRKDIARLHREIQRYGFLNGSKRLKQTKQSAGGVSAGYIEMVNWYARVIPFDNRCPGVKKFI
jgi:hypothetical protein